LHINGDSWGYIKPDSDKNLPCVCGGKSGKWQGKSGLQCTVTQIEADTINSHPPRRRRRLWRINIHPSVEVEVGLAWQEYGGYIGWIWMLLVLQDVLSISGYFRGVEVGGTGARLFPCLPDGWLNETHSKRH